MSIIQVAQGKRNTVKFRDGPAAVTGNIRASTSHCENGKAGSRSKAGSQKTCLAALAVKPDGKGFCRCFLQNSFFSGSAKVDK
jgi:hypothetical protein